MAEQNYLPRNLEGTLRLIAKAGADGLPLKDFGAEHAAAAWAHLIELGAVDVTQVSIITETRMVANRHGRAMLRQFSHEPNCASLKGPTMACDCGARLRPDTDDG